MLMDFARGKSVAQPGLTLPALPARPLGQHETKVRLLGEGSSRRLAAKARRAEVGVAARTYAPWWPRATIPGT